MVITGPQLRTRAQVLADMVGDPFLSDTEWDDLINDGIEALWSDVTSVNKDFRNNVSTFTLAGSVNSVALPNDFREVRFVRRDPGQTTQIILTKLGQRSGSLGFDRSYRLQDRALYIEPLTNSAGNYDLTYVPTPLLVSQSDFLTSLITVGPLPSYNATGAGIGSHLLTATANGVLFVDGITVTAGNTVIVNNEDSDPTQNGFYQCTQTGTAGQPFKLLRVKPSATVLATLGFQTKISAGMTEAFTFWRLTTYTGDDLGPQKYTEQGLDVELAQFNDYVVLYATIEALGKDESDTSTFFRLLHGTPGDPHDTGVRGRVMRWASDQRSADPDQVEDVRGRRRRPGWL